MENLWVQRWYQDPHNLAASNMMVVGFYEYEGCVCVSVKQCFCKRSTFGWRLGLPVAHLT